MCGCVSARGGTSPTPRAASKQLQAPQCGPRCGRCCSRGTPPQTACSLSTPREGTPLYPGLAVPTRGVCGQGGAAPGPTRCWLCKQAGREGCGLGRRCPKSRPRFCKASCWEARLGEGWLPHLPCPLHNRTGGAALPGGPHVPRNKAREGARPPASCPGVPTRSLPHPCPARGRGSGGRRRAAHTRLCVLAGFTSRGRSRRGVGRAPGRPRPRSCARSAASRIPGAARQAPVCVGAGQVRGHRRSWPPWGSRSPPSGLVPPCPPCPHLLPAPHCRASWAGLRAGCNPAPLPLWGSRAGLGAAPLQGTSPYRVPVAGRPWGPHRRGGSPHSPRPGGSAGQGDPGGGGAGGLAVPSDRSKCQISSPLRGLGTWARAQPAQTGRGEGQRHPSTPLGAATAGGQRSHPNLSHPIPSIPSHPIPLARPPRAGTPPQEQRSLFPPQSLSFKHVFFFFFFTFGPYEDPLKPSLAARR